MKLVNFFKNRFLLNTPFKLIHSVTSNCNCKCKLCNVWTKSSDSRNELTTDEALLMLENAEQAGISSYTAMGGEPLLRNDLHHILKYAKQLNFTTSLVTNGFFLFEKFAELSPFTDLLIVSIDSNDELHDELRGVQGIRKKAIEGIKLWKNAKTKIVINTTVNNLNLVKIESLLKLSKELNVSINFQPMALYKGYNDQYKCTTNELKNAFSQILYFKKLGYSIINSTQYLKYFLNKKQYKCHGPKCFISVESNGDISSCLDIFDMIWGNVRNTNFKELFTSKEFKEFCKKAEKCNECNDVKGIESSLFYSLNPKFLIENAFTYKKLL